MTSEHNQEVQELFLNMTASVSKGMDAHEVRLISLENFTMAIDTMMDKAYYYGLQNGFDRASSVVSETFTK